MINLNNRIYEELNEWKYTESILIEFSICEFKKIKITNALLIMISLTGIAGWFRFEEYKTFWTIILILAQGVRMMQNVLFWSNDELYNIKNSISFYTFNLLDLENLYYDYHNGKVPDSTIEKRFNKLKEKERNLFEKQTFGKINPGDRLIKIAEEETDTFLNKIKKNVNNG